jgi:DNA (cytosine-5)-methyltransferase 1
VFVVASSRDDINPAEILFEFEGLRRDTPQSRKTGQEVAGTIAARFGISRNNIEECVPVVGASDTECGGNKLTHQSVANGHIVAARMVSFGEYSVDGTASAMKARDWKDATDLVAQPVAVYENHPSDSRVTELGDVSSTVRARWGTGGGNAPMVAQPIGTDLYNCTITGDIACTFTADATSATHSGPTVMQAMAVRRLTPTERERLQGFPDGYTNIPWRKAAESPDGPRYKALGNSWAVPVVAWIGKRIQDQIK